MTDPMRCEGRSQDGGVNSVIGDGLSERSADHELSGVTLFAGNDLARSFRFLQ